MQGLSPMAKGFVAGFIRRNDEWISHWEYIDKPGIRRDVAYRQARDRLTYQMSWPGDAIARRKMVFVDGLCPDGRELIEKVAEALRGD